MRRLVGFLVPVVVCAASVCGAAETVDLEAVNRIRDEGLHRSQVMDLAWHLTEAVGPRLTASPGMHEAAEWAQRLTTGPLGDQAVGPERLRRLEEPVDMLLQPKDVAAVNADALEDPVTVKESGRKRTY